ncbi:MAG: hypothetical protein Q9201_003409 [Fulgogasparrea decipioides]
MQPAPNNVMVGDIYILEENVIIGVIGGLKFQRILRTTLDTLLPPEPSPRSTHSAGIQRMNKATASDIPVEKPSSKAVDVRKTTKQQKAATPRSLQSAFPLELTSHGGISAAALKIISQETELPLTELLDDCLFADIGVDSLLSLQIVGKMREILDIDLPNSVFLDQPTIGELRLYLSQFGGEKSSSGMTSTSGSAEDDIDGYHDYRSDSSVSCMELVESTKPMDAVSPSDLAASQPKAIMKLIRTTVAEQMGVGLEEIVGSNDLLSLGLDSLMTIVILGILREQTGLDLPANLFLEHPSIDAVEKFLQSATPQFHGKVNAVRSSRKPGTSTPATPPPRAVSVLMQGKPRTASTTLFLLPDGSGSATSYAYIPAVDPRIAIYALNSPFMTDPSEFTNGIPGIASLYLAEIRRRQPHGPYHLGGWSAGGVIAYEITQQLLSDRERVATLLLFDSPCPLGLEPLPSRLHHFFAEIGLLAGEGQEIPAWLLPHFEASIKALTAYQPAPIKNQALAPKTLATWARYGVCRYPEDPRPKPSDDEPKSMKWLLDNRTDFEFNGWDALLGKDAIESTSVEGNHFTLMKEPAPLRKLAKLITGFL